VSPAQLDTLSAPVRAAYVAGYADSLQTVFLVAVPIAIVAFAFTFLLPEIQLRTTVGSADAGETFAVPHDRTSLQEVEHQLNQLLRRENRADMYRRLTERAGLDLEPRPTWLLYRVEEHPAGTLAELAGREVDPEALRPLVRRLADRGLVEVAPADEAISLTPGGRAALDRLTAARCDGLSDLLAGWSPEEHAELAERLQQLAHDLLADGDRMLRDAEPTRSA